MGPNPIDFSGLHRWSLSGSRWTCGTCGLFVFSEGKPRVRWNVKDNEFSVMVTSRFGGSIYLPRSQAQPDCRNQVAQSVIGS
jgi:hypothetical protein